MTIQLFSTFFIKKTCYFGKFIILLQRNIVFKATEINYYYY